MKNHWKRITFTAFVLIATYFVIHFTLLDESPNKLLFNIISVIGSVASIYAIGEAIYQIRSVKQEQECIKNAINEKIIFVENKDVAMNLSQHIETCDHAIKMMKNENMEATRIYLQSLFSFTIDLESISSLNLKGDKELKKKQNSLKVDLSKIRNAKSSSDIDELTRIRMINSWGDLQEYFTRLSSDLKHDNYEK